MADKRVDESWKDSVNKEKGIPSAGPAAAPPPDSSFPFFISTLAMQALAALGELPDPSGVKKPSAAPPDLESARYLIDVLNMLYELQMKFVQKNGTA